jgi:hypothetical protein
MEFLRCDACTALTRAMAHCLRRQLFTVSHPKTECTCLLLFGVPYSHICSPETSLKDAKSSTKAEFAPVLKSQTRDTGKTEYLHTISKSSSASLNQTILILIKINDPAKARSFKSPPSHDYQHKKNVNCEIFFCAKQTINRPTAMLIITLHFRFSPNWDDYGYR